MRIRKFLKWWRDLSNSGALMHNVRQPFEMYRQGIGDAYLSAASQDGPVYPKHTGKRVRKPQAVCLSTDDLYDLLRIGCPLGGVSHPDLAEYAEELADRLSVMSEQVDLPELDEVDLSEEDAAINHFYDLCEDVANLTADGYMVVTGQVDEQLVLAAEKMLEIIGDIPDDGSQYGAMSGHARAVLAAYAG